MADSAPALRHIVAATDFSPAAELAVARAAQLAAAAGAALTLVHVLPVSVWKDTVAIVADLYLHRPTPYDPHKLEAETQAKLDALAADVRARGGLDCRARLRSGRPPAEIAAAAAEAGADLLVIGAHGAHRLHEWLLGTTTQKLARIAACPVLVVRKPAGAPYATVLVPTDLSAPSARAARFAAALFPQATFHVAHAWQLPYEGLLRYASTDSAAIETYRTQADARLRAALADFIAGVGFAGGRVVPHVRHGYAPRSIDDWIRALGADLVVLAAQGKSDLAVAFLGSVSLHVLHAAPCDVLLVRGGAGA
jgi:nucleotide-binding universal stress UspA family protein